MDNTALAEFLYLVARELHGNSNGNDRLRNYHEELSHSKSSKFDYNNSMNTFEHLKSK